MNVASDHGDWGGKPLVSEDDWRSGSEYGGVGGLIAPIDSAHTLVMPAHEQLTLIKNINAQDATTQPVAETKLMAK